MTQCLEFDSFAEAGQLLKNNLCVVGDGGFAGQETKIGIVSGGLFMLIASSQMNVTFQLAMGPANNKGHLGMGFVTQDAI